MGRGRMIPRMKKERDGWLAMKALYGCWKVLTKSLRQLVKAKGRHLRLHVRSYNVERELFVESLEEYIHEYFMLPAHVSSAECHTPSGRTNIIHIRTINR
jgi:hypothetical protein